MGKMTICIECKHYTNKIINHCPNIWYSHYCKASPNELKMSPVTGEEEYEFGEEYQYCREINVDGKCLKFSRREN